MKKYIYITILLGILVSCKQEQTAVDYTLISGRITNPSVKMMSISSDQDLSYKKEITLLEDGTFRDTLRVNAGFYSISQERIETPLYLSSGSTITLNYDTKDYDNTLVVNGKKSEATTYVITKQKIIEKHRLSMEFKDTLAFFKEETAYKKMSLAVKAAEENMLKCLSPKGMTNSEQHTCAEFVEV
jgi:hypothetical protein